MLGREQPAVLFPAYPPITMGLLNGLGATPYAELAVKVAVSHRDGGTRSERVGLKHQRKTAMEWVYRHRRVLETEQRLRSRCGRQDHARGQDRQ